MPDSNISFWQQYGLPIVAGIVTFMSTIVGWVFSRQIAKIDKISDDLEKHKLYASNHFATHADIEELKEGIYDRLDRHEGKIDGFIQAIAIAVPREEFQKSTDQIHQRINELQSSKADK
jgi:hypothetical protein